MKNEDELKRDFDVLFIRAKSLGLSQQDIGELCSVRKISERKWTRMFLIMSIFAIGALAAVAVQLRVYQLPRLSQIMGYTEEEQCFLDLYEPISDMMRPVVDCKICEHVRQIDRVTNLSHADFMKNYAFTGRPVVVTDGMKDWSAPEHFSFQFFKKLYKKNSPNMIVDGGEECQFFPYRTEFESLGDVFSMPADMRDGVSGKPWYIGW